MWAQGILSPLKGNTLICDGPQGWLLRGPVHSSGEEPAGPFDAGDTWKKTESPGMDHQPCTPQLSWGTHSQRGPHRDSVL